MPRKRTKKVEPVAVVPEPQPELQVEPQAEPQPESVAKKEFRKLIERYKVQEPEKYARKEQELLNKLNSL